MCIGLCLTFFILPFVNDNETQKREDISKKCSSMCLCQPECKDTENCVPTDTKGMTGPYKCVEKTKILSKLWWFLSFFFLCLLWPLYMLAKRNKIITSDNTTHYPTSHPTNKKQ